MATLIGSLLVQLGLESGQFKSGLSAAEKQLQASQKRIEKIGKGMAGWPKVTAVQAVKHSNGEPVTFADGSTLEMGA